MVKAWSEAHTAIDSAQWDLVILDEINYAISHGMLVPAQGGGRPEKQT